MATFEIPLTPTPQTFETTLQGQRFRLTVLYRAGWTLDIADANDVRLISGLPLVPGVDLLAQHRHAGVPGSLYVQGATQPDDLPTFDDLGRGSRVFWVSEDSNVPRQSA